MPAPWLGLLPLELAAGTLPAVPVLDWLPLVEFDAWFCEDEPWLADGNELDLLPWAELLELDALWAPVSPWLWDWLLLADGDD